jgi:hypothetical protein
VSEDGLIAEVNLAAEKSLGRPAEDLLGHDAHDLLHRDSHGHSLARSQCGIREATLSSMGSSGHGWFERGDGTLLAASWVATPYDIGGQGTGAVILLHEPEPYSAPQGSGGVPEQLTELDRLTLLAELTTQLTSTLNVYEALHRLVRLIVPRLADWAVIDLVTEVDEVRRTLVVHHVDGRLVPREDLQGPMPPVPQESPMPLSKALRGAASTLADSTTYQGPPDSEIAVEQYRLFKESGMHSAAIAPIRGLREVIGALTLGRAQQPQAFTAEDLPLLEDITGRAGLALDNARLYQQQRKVAETMQRHLLPQLPTVPGLEMAARYQPAPHASQVGGDWYDAFPLADAGTALVVGDVVGHDLDAAAGMAQVRNMLRAYAWSQQDDPSAVVTKLDQAVMRIAEVPLATVILGRIVAGDDGLWRFRWTNAGHPDPLLVTYDGHADYLIDGHGMLLGSGRQSSAGRGHHTAAARHLGAVHRWPGRIALSPHRRWSRQALSARRLPGASPPGVDHHSATGPGQAGRQRRRRRGPGATYPRLLTTVRPPPSPRLHLRRAEVSHPERKSTPALRRATQEENP